MCPRSRTLELSMDRSRARSRSCGDARQATEPDRTEHDRTEVPMVTAPCMTATDKATGVAEASKVEIDKSDVNANSLNVDQFLQPQWWIPEVDGVCVGDHRFLQVLGEGTHGRVYKVADQLCGGFNAVKVIRKNRLKSMDEVYGIAGECNTLAWLKHPNIIQLRGAVHANQNFYVFMEFAGNISLHNVLQTRDEQIGLDLKIARQLFNQIADAVAYCHWHGLAHCVPYHRPKHFWMLKIVCIYGCVCCESRYN
ncbi:unnamed protein product [Effrenium voratum]|uniref:Protein kinase domain-containing protein n=1 Tax=Effrenium voratum TaxID=2562239 RepID=A0AA36N4G0_9DINO|nr:unnamed protein product [Effrenium voratum]